MSGTYSLRWEDKRLVFTLDGVFDHATWTAFDTRMKAELVKAPRGGWTVLGDLSNFPPQTDEVQAGAKVQMAEATRLGCRKSVLVVPKAVAAMQAKRLVKESGDGQETAFVTTLGEADAVLAPVEASL